MAIQDLRQNYTPEPIDPEDLSADPFDQFTAWFDDAQQAGILEPNAFTLATASADGTPNARTLLLKGIDDAKPAAAEPGSGGDKAPDRGFVFYTNYASAKGEELAANPRACMNFYWDTLSRCVRVHGSVTKVDAEETAAYFKTRPRESQLGAWCSEQSSVIDGREDLMLKFFQLTEEYPDETPIPVPPTWGGYRVVPTSFEFWQGQPSRLHDRLRYLPDGGAWKIERLSP
ncbi:pyridoxamine 5'-phosphate oxidase [Algisphaera agarilytica]|uniref:Pyridoxine/pyridoxamine 5'-phosphate oxidase n=1 Tax=Algisphaera agarilytica TaxID=1385975 RepID=A0A7X0H705_9BACT|nr:pyridoxamine 5'-phosphate oxidase [Algisphaera agarilytica]MBB6428965.1 pyridoxamine 5'-phosphate oxidase [Algisphaera agarilytica]